MRGAGQRGWCQRKRRACCMGMGMGERLRVVLRLRMWVLVLRKGLLWWQRMVLIVQSVWSKRCLQLQWGLQWGCAQRIVVLLLMLLLLVEEGSVVGLEALQVGCMQGQPLRSVQGAIRALLQRAEVRLVVMELFLRWLHDARRTQTTGRPRVDASPVDQIQKCGTSGTVTGSS